MAFTIETLKQQMSFYWAKSKSPLFALVIEYVAYKSVSSAFVFNHQRLFLIFHMHNHSDGKPLWIIVYK